MPKAEHQLKLLRLSFDNEHTYFDIKNLCHSHKGEHTPALMAFTRVSNAHGPQPGYRKKLPVDVSSILPVFKHTRQKMYLHKHALMNLIILLKGIIHFVTNNRLWWPSGPSIVA